MKSALQTWVILGLTLLLVASVRIRLLNTPLERDEGEYAYAGQLLLHGVAPYKDVYNMKLPGTYAAYAAIMGVFGQTPAGVHLGLLAVNGGCILLMFLVGRKLLDESTGLAAAVTFALLSLSPSVLGLAGHATHFVALFALGGILLLLYACPLEPTPASNLPAVSPRLLLFSSGLLLGLAFVMKQHGLFFALFGLGFLLWTYLHSFTAAAQAATTRKRHHHRRRHAHRVEPVAIPVARAKNLIAAAREQAAAAAQALAPAATAPATSEIERAEPAAGMIQPSMAQSALAKHFQPRPAQRPDESRDRTDGAPPGRMLVAKVTLPQIALFCAGLALPYLLTCLLLAAAGAFHQFWFWTFTYAAKYASAIPFSDSSNFLSGAWAVAIGPALLLWLLALGGALLMWWDDRLANSHRVFLVALLLCSLGSISVGFYFRPHYFITLLPCISLLVGVAVSRAANWLRGTDWLSRLLAVPLLLVFGIGALAAIVGNGQLWFSLSPDAVSRETYGTTLFSKAEELARQLKAETPPGARIAVLGSEPEIYFLSQRRSATGYIYTYPLMESHPYARTMQQNMSAEIERAKPDYVVYVDDPMSWLQTPESDMTIFKWWHDYAAAHFEVAQTIEVPRGREQAELMQREQAPGSSLPATRLFLFRRR